MHIEIFTDGSCHTQKRAGTWAGIILFENNEEILSGLETDTTHNRMELLAIINSIDYAIEKYNSFEEITVYTDSQYAVNLPNRISRLRKQNYLTKAGVPIQNADLVKRLMSVYEQYRINLVKVKAHQKEDGTKNYNRIVDKIVRKNLRDYIKT